MRELKSSLASRQSLAPALRITTATGTAIDRTGFESVTFVVHVGAWTDGQHIVYFEHSDDGSTYYTCLEDDLVGATVNLTTGEKWGVTIEDDGSSPTAPTYHNENILIGYVGDRQYIRPKSYIDDAPNTGAFIGVDAILGHASKRPTA
ncbi:hypothetical protein [Mesorhizobium sp. B2-3-5]|uniref:hypothetical protein n=1 Tax=Mesorhizobium sp. B2-3-5 TaxID=2589958 RepID=UPI001126F255|nr:hypothetical protein [Mesorhizobium sp. B2-3-5]TPM36629.1 hypothetical protein FJ958_02050 [Mesorhizobium sp. B2-3-5]